MAYISDRYRRGSDGCGKGARPGDFLGPHLWPGKVQMPSLLADWPADLDFAVQHGWVERLDGDRYRLTVIGFSVAQSSN